MRAARFPARAQGPAERVAGFVAHLRLNGLRAGPAETAAALDALAAVNAADPAEARLALRSLFARGPEGWARYDALHDAYWFAAPGREKARAAETRRAAPPARPALWSRHLADGPAEPGGAPAGADDGEGEAEGADGRLVATRTASVARRDLRDLADPEALREAARVAERLAAAIRDRRSRRRRAARRGGALDLRRIARASLARGGEPIDLSRRRRRDRPVRFLALLDVSGSMQAYARVFVAFLKGLVSADERAAAFLFHTRLIRVSDALREPDALKAAARLSLMAEGFGGGTDIGGCLAAFNAQHGKGLVNRRTVALILSDGCCSGPPARLGAELARLRRRAGRIVWLNPLAGWKGYAPVAAGIAAALPHLDAHLPANTLAALAALEAEFERL